MGFLKSKKVAPTPPPDPAIATAALLKQQKAKRNSFLAFRRRLEIQRNTLRGNPGLAI